MAAQGKSFDHANAMPASTWRFLNANDVAIEVPEGLAVASDVRVSGSFEMGDDGAFDRALDCAQVAWELEHPAPTAEEIAEREKYRAAESDATYGGTAQSRYQENADALEEARSLSAAFEHGTGGEVASFLREAAGERTVMRVSPGESAKASVVVSADPGVLSVGALDIIALRGSEVSVSIVVDSPEGASSEAAAVAGTTVRVYADEDAHVRVARVQTLENGCIDIDDMGLIALDRARIEVSQTVLGATSTFTGLAGDLRGDSARVSVETRYLGWAEQSRDFNYSLRHHGARTRCNLNANGVLAGKSSKTLRGTIDLVRGCKGAEGSENETVLLVDEGVRNTTVPVILCNEDDVAGNHGATIGHIRKEQLFYLESRGIPREAAEALFVQAVIEQAAIEAPVEAARAAVVRLGERLEPGFSERFN